MNAQLIQGPADDVRARRREQRAWYFYDWANSAYFLVVVTTLFLPYMTTVASRAACPGLDSDQLCTANLSVLGFPVAAGSLALYVTTASTLFSAVTLPIVGAFVDRTRRKRHVMAGFAWIGSLATMAMYFLSGSSWQIGVVTQFVANVCIGASMVAYSAIMIDISTPDERDGVSSRGWALGYLGSSLLLVGCLFLVLNHDQLGLTKEHAVRISLLAAGIWWGGFTWIPFLGLKDREPRLGNGEKGLFSASFGQLWETAKELRAFPQTMLFLGAFLFFNDGIQTVVAAAGLYGEKQLQFSTSVIMATLLVVQLTAFVGALLFGRLAARRGARITVLIGITCWVVLVCVAFFLPAKVMAPFLVVSVGMGLVLGGVQALARSMYSHLVPAGREAEFISLYQAVERGTSWLGTLCFGLVFQATGSYRPALLSLLAFFLIGGLMLLRVNMRKGIADAGNEAPKVV